MFIKTFFLNIKQKVKSVYDVHNLGHEHTCHPLDEEVVIALLAGGSQHPDDVRVVQVAHHSDLLSQRLHDFFLL